MKYKFIGDTDEPELNYGLNIGDIVDIYFEEEPCGDDYVRYYYFLNSDIGLDIDLFEIC